MKRFLLFIMVSLVALSLCACSFNKDVKEKPIGFAINNWSSGLGAVDENSLDKSDYSYTLYLTSETEKLEEVKEVNPVIGENIIDKVISNELPQFEVKNNCIEVNGNIVFDTKGLTKEQIVELEPYIVSVKIIMKDNTPMC